MQANPIKQRRSELGVSSVELAALCDVSAALVNCWEVGRSMPSDGHVDELSDVLKLDPARLRVGLRAFRKDIVQRAQSKIVMATT